MALRTSVFRSGALGPAATPPAPCIHLTPADLAARWSITKSALAKQRMVGSGCRFLKVGRRVVYRLSDVEAWEQSRERNSTSDPGPSVH